MKLAVVTEASRLIGPDVGDAHSLRQAVDG
jgi:hypothetical protein